MTIASVQAAFETAIQSFATTNSLPVAWEGVHFDPGTSTKYIAPRMSARTRDPINVGANSRFMHSGIYQVLVVGEVGTGTAAILAIGDLLIAAFPRSSSLTTTDSKSVIIRSVSVQPIMVDGDSLNMPVLIDWFSFDV